ncbi:MAG: DUF4010 domain-containing protein, partial [Alphaproteobacteria bacterium]|nr:DUF4010 domain-containing protein [Alphaproteobacteria bacterium]
LIASISFVGYFAVKIGGTHRGLIFTGLFAGLSSSTALTMHFARLAKANPSHRFILASGILAACGTMFPRVLFVCFLINPALGSILVMPVVIMTLLIYAPALVIWFRHREPVSETIELKQNPLELSTALAFGSILTAIILASHVLRDSFGSMGVYMLSMISGMTDVDAITLTLARQSSDAAIAVNSAQLQEASIAILIAAATNSLVKASLAAGLSNQNLLRPVTAPLVIAVLAGLASLLLT